MIRSRTSASAKRPSRVRARAVVLQIVKKISIVIHEVAATCLSLHTTHTFAQRRKTHCSSHYTSHPSLTLASSDSVSSYISLLLSSLVQVPLVPVTCRRRDALFGSRSQAVIEWRLEVGCSRGHMDEGDEGLQASGRPSKNNLPPYTSVQQASVHRQAPNQSRTEQNSNT